MGLRMDDLHAPTVGAGPTSAGHGNGIPKAQLSLRELITEKDRVEAELKALGQVLDSHGVNMSTGLTTFDGFPRADIDVAQIRTTRSRIIRLKNDYKDLMARIEIGLHEHHAQVQANGTSPMAFANATASATGNLEVPFARVNSVVSGSPAEAAGLKAGDTLIKFGWVDWSNNDRLTRLSQAVSQNEGLPLHIKILRPNPSSNGPSIIVELQLTPRSNWGGRGMLGCHLLPM